MRNRHGGQTHVGGIRLRSSHTEAPEFFEGVQGISVAESRSGEAIQVPDMGEKIVQTGHFDYAAHAPNVNNNPLAPTEADVVIDSTGITIRNGKLFLEDYGGNSVLGPAGFDGSWVEYISNGVYNGSFTAGITTWITPGVSGTGDSVAAVTMVNDAETIADYNASLSAAIPYWIIQEYSSSDDTMVAFVAADSTDGRYLVFERQADAGGGPVAGGYMTAMQDVPVVQGRDYEVDLNFEFVSSGGMEDSSLGIYWEWMDSTHAPLTLGALSIAWNYMPSTATDPSGRHVENIGTAPANARYLRTGIRVTHGANASGLGRILNLYEVAIRPILTTTTVDFPAYVSSDNVVNSLVGDLNSGHLHFRLASLASGYSDLRFRWGGDTDDMVRIERGSIAFGTGLSTVDTRIARSSAGFLSAAQVDGTPGGWITGETVINDGSIELRKTGYTPHIDFTNDASTDYDVRLILTGDNVIQVHGGKIESQTEQWIQPSLVNSWANFGAPFKNCAYRIDAAGYVHLAGIVKSGTIGAAIFNLPSGYRPDSTLAFSSVSNSAFAQVRVNANGDVVAQTGSNVSMVLDGIVFLAEA